MASKAWGVIAEFVLASPAWLRAPGAVPGVAELGGALLPSCAARRGAAAAPRHRRGCASGRARLPRLRSPELLQEGMGEERTPSGSQKGVALTFLMKRFSFRLVVFKSIIPKFADLEEKQGKKFSLCSLLL